MAPLPHGWYGHDATTPTDRLERLKARDASVEAAARIVAAYRPLRERRTAVTTTSENIERINNDAYEYNGDGHVVVHDPNRKRDYPDAFSRPSNAKSNNQVKKARRFSDAGAAPAASWFPTWTKGSNTASKAPDSAGKSADKRAKFDEKKRAERWHQEERRLAAIEKRVAEAIKKRLIVRSADPLTCASHNVKCRSVEEARAMADRMAGRR